MPPQTDETGSTAADEAVPPLPASELMAMLSDPDVPDEAIRPYLKLDGMESTAFRPVVVIDPAKVVQGPEESAFALASLNGVSRWRRQQRYRRKIAAGWSGLRIVSEGDSWFQYPFLLDDVIDQLFDEFAVFSLDAAGDLLQDMKKQDELSDAIAAEQPQVVLLSGGGNDLLGDGRLRSYLLPFKAGRLPEDYLKPDFDILLNQLVDLYREIALKAAAQGVRRVVMHSYDWAIPDAGRWLGRPMSVLGIEDAALQRAIVKIIVNRFHAALGGLARERKFGGRLVLADCRGSIRDDQWHDELHPTDAGFASAAARIRRLITEGLTESAAASVAAASARESTEAASPEPDFIGMEDDDLFAEVARRVMLLEESGAAGTGTARLTAASAREGAVDSLIGLGKRIVSRLYRELHKLLCGASAEDAAQREKLRSAFGLGDAAVTAAIATALTTALGVAPLVAPVVAAVLYKRLLQPTWEETCAAWEEALAETK